MTNVALNAVKAFLLSTAGLYLIGLAGAALTYWAVNNLINLFSKNPKLQPLEPLAKDLGDAMIAAEKAALADLAAGKSVAAAKDALKAAEAVGKSDLPDVGTALKAEADVLLNGPKTTAETPGGTVNLPVAGTVAKPGNKGVIPLLVLLILAIGGGLIAAGAITLAATGNGKQDISCAEAALTGNPVAFGTVLAGLSQGGTSTGQSQVESGLEGLEPNIGKCLLVSLWSDIEAAKAKKQAMQLGVATVAIAQAPTATIQAQAQDESVRRGWYPPGTVQQ